MRRPLTLRGLVDQPGCLCCDHGFLDLWISKQSLKMPAGIGFLSSGGVPVAAHQQRHADFGRLHPFRKTVNERIIFRAGRPGKRAERRAVAPLAFEQRHLQPELRQAACHHGIGDQLKPHMPAVAGLPGDDRKLIRRQAYAGLNQQPMRFIEQPAALLHGVPVSAYGRTYEPDDGKGCKGAEQIGDRQPGSLHNVDLQPFCRLQATFLNTLPAGARAW